MKLIPIKLVLPLLLGLSLTLSAQIQFSPEKIYDAALNLTNQQVIYDGSYYSIPYPNGDVPDGIGV